MAVGREQALASRPCMGLYFKVENRDGCDYHPEGVGYQKRPFAVRLIALQGARNYCSMSVRPRKIGSESTSAVGSNLVFNERGKTWEGFRTKKCELSKSHIFGIFLNIKIY